MTARRTYERTAYGSPLAHLEDAVDQVGDRLNSIDRRLDGFGNEIGGLRTRAERSQT